MVLVSPLFLIVYFLVENMLGDFVGIKFSFCSYIRKAVSGTGKWNYLQHRSCGIFPEMSCFPEMLCVFSHNGFGLCIYLLLFNRIYFLHYVVVLESAKKIIVYLKQPGKSSCPGAVWKRIKKALIFPVSSHQLEVASLRNTIYWSNLS